MTTGSSLRKPLKQGSQTHISMWAAVAINRQSTGRTIKIECFYYVINTTVSK